VVVTADIVARETARLHDLAAGTGEAGEAGA